MIEPRKLTTTYCPETDTLLLYFGPEGEPEEDGEDVAENVVLHFNAGDRPAALEIEHASVVLAKWLERP